MCCVCCFSVFAFVVPRRVHLGQYFSAVIGLTCTRRLYFKYFQNYSQGVQFSGFDIYREKNPTFNDVKNPTFNDVKNPTFNDVKNPTFNDVPVWDLTQVTVADLLHPGYFVIIITVITNIVVLIKIPNKIEKKEFIYGFFYFLFCCCCCLYVVVVVCLGGGRSH